MSTDAVAAVVATKKRPIDGISAAPEDLGNGEVKRQKNAEGNAVVQSTAAALAPEAEQPGSWDCPACSNTNWPRRTVCNRKGCNTPKPGLEPEAIGSEHPEGSWKCNGCHNVNWPKRTSCNRCQLPKSGMGGPAFGMPGHGQGHGNGQQQGGGHPAGSWNCSQCNNVNWPLRTSCNRCQASRQTADASAHHHHQQQQQQYAMPQQMYGGMGGGYGFAPPQMAGYPGSIMQQAGPHGYGAVGQQVPPGYGAVVQQTGYGMAAAAPQQGGAPGYGAAAAAPSDTVGIGPGNPAGSWKCGQCANVNWPLRTSCNRCEAKRGAGAGAAAAANSNGAAPPQQQQQQQQYAAYGAAPQQPYAAYGAAPQQGAYGAPQGGYGMVGGYGAGAQGGAYGAAPQGGGGGGYQAQQQQQQPQQHPAGSWKCASCNNTNWPLRTACNRCKEPKGAAGAIAGGAPAQQYGMAGNAGGHAGGGGGGGAGGHPEGSWKCTGCQNVNWPLRSSCNRCQASKETSAGPL